MNDILSFFETGRIQFAEVTDMRICREENDAVMFSCKMMRVLQYDEHVAAYIVDKTQEVVFVKHENLTDYHPLSLYGGRYIVENYLLEKKNGTDLLPTTNKKVC